MGQGHRLGGFSGGLKKWGDGEVRWGKLLRVGGHCAGQQAEYGREVAPFANLPSCQ